MPKVGYKNPPVEHRFPPGVSGNPAGGKPGPRKKKRRPHPFDQISEFTTPYGVKKQIVGERLLEFAVHVLRIEKDPKLERVLRKHLDRIEHALHRAKVREETYYYRSLLWAHGDNLRNSNDALQHLGMGRLLRPNTKKPCVKLEPWIVQAAIDRMETGQLTREEQQRVIESTRTAWKLVLPDWWSPDIKGKKRKSKGSE